MNQRSLRWQAGAFALLAGCSGGAFSPRAGQSNAAVSSLVHGVLPPPSALRGIYVGLDTASTNMTVLGYPTSNRKNRGPNCSEKAGAATGDIAVDDNGNLMVTVASSRGAQVLVYQGSRMCGPLLGTLATNAVSIDVASADAVHGKIIVGNIEAFGSGGLGDVEICTLSGGCATSLKNRYINGVIGVALARNGDCWASAGGLYTPVLLVYFKGCSGSGQIATGFKNVAPGGLDIDSAGDLVSIDPGSSFGTAFSVYKACNPICTLVGGPFAAKGYTNFGHLNKRSTKLIGADYQYGQIDVYAYSPKEINYEYSFNNGLSVNSVVMGAAYNPRSKE